MSAFLEEFIVVLSYSTKTQLSIFFGIVFYFGTLALGQHAASTLIAQGMFAPLMDALRAIIEHRYEKLAWGSLFGFMLLAVKCYKKDRKRFLGL